MSLPAVEHVRFDCLPWCLSSQRQQRGNVWQQHDTNAAASECCKHGLEDETTYRYDVTEDRRMTPSDRFTHKHTRSSKFRGGRNFCENREALFTILTIFRQRVWNNTAYSTVAVSTQTIFTGRQHNLLYRSPVLAIVRAFVCLCVCSSVALCDSIKTLQSRITKSSLSAS